VQLGYFVHGPYIFGVDLGIKKIEFVNLTGKVGSFLTLGKLGLGKIDTFKAFFSGLRGVLLDLLFFFLS
jgi:hypothetical protein